MPGSRDLSDYKSCPVQLEQKIYVKRPPGYPQYRQNFQKGFSLQQLGPALRIREVETKEESRNNVQCP